jgi:hypothetical protein
VNRIALAIVLGCAAIAAALYFGLRERAAPATAAHDVQRALPPDRDVVSALTMQAAGQLEAERAQIVAACWTGPRDPQRYDVQIAVGADGREIGRSVSEVRDAPSRPDIAACVRRQNFPPIAIAPPGTPLTITIPLVLP